MKSTLHIESATAERSRRRESRARGRWGSYDLRAGANVGASPGRGPPAVSGCVPRFVWPTLYSIVSGTRHQTERSNRTVRPLPSVCPVPVTAHQRTYRYASVALVVRF